MASITPFLWFNDDAEDAIAFYASIFPDARISDVQRQNGKFFLGQFELAGQKLMALNGGPQFQFTEAISLYVNCKDQAEVDYYWDRLLDGGGKPQQCGWLKDRYGLCWQIIPEALPSLIGDPDPKKAERAMKAMLQMVKIDVAQLEAAHRGDRI
ncbi:VOC family protein [Chelativorans sp. ZYF759]|uniref:VOC family protein n=1 Tax=Chelativorans sp. ZYF759 TaxID=2692213 RepID=UPI00145D576F|nr:VOC family protein [Chelativorans sp. ZYF759]NMG39420.1 VOC family protein [Chelativorans sp. ZYF759]